MTTTIKYQHYYRIHLSPWRGPFMLQSGWVTVDEMKNFDFGLNLKTFFNVLKQKHYHKIASIGSALRLNSQRMMNYIVDQNLKTEKKVAPYIFL